MRKSISKFFVLLITLLIGLSATAQGQLSEEAKDYLIRHNMNEHKKNEDYARIVEVYDRFLAQSHISAQDRASATFLKARFIIPDDNSQVTPAHIKEAEKLIDEALAMDVLTSEYVIRARDFRNYINSDGVYAQPLIRMPPIMPEGVKKSGHCRIRFDINTKGNPENVDAYFCSDPVFKTGSERAASKFKYMPRLVDGVPITMYAVETRINYRYIDDYGNRVPE